LTTTPPTILTPAMGTQIPTGRVSQNAKYGEIH